MAYAGVPQIVISWLCSGENSSTVDNVSSTLHHTEDWPTNTCSLDLVLLITHVVFCMMALLVFIFIPLCNITRTTDQVYLIRYPGHVIRWLLYMMYILVCLGKLGEGILSSHHHHFDNPPRLYIVPLVALPGAILIMVYYGYMEYWDLPAMWPLQCIYCVCVLVVECIKGSSLHYDDIASYHMIWVFNKLVIAVAGTMCLVEIYFLMKKKFSLTPSPKDLPADWKNTSMKFLDDHCSLPASLLYSWLDELFKTGMRRSIEEEDMGNLPHKHSANYASECFAKILCQQQEEASKRGCETHFYQVLFRFLYRGIYISGILKFLGDSSSFVTPYLIAGIIGWAALQTKDTEEVGPTTHTTETYMTVRDFCSNGFVLVAALFVQLVFQKICNQLSYHYIILEAAKVRAAIQAAVYAKSLRLSCSAVGNGSLTTGQITNHMSEDPRAIFMALQWLHSCWSIPFQVVVFLIILYHQLGLSALLSCFILPISVPLQLFIANRQTFYQKHALKLSDVRLKQTNEVLQGIKVVKLNAWESIFQKAIETTRNKEVAKLKMKMFWQVQLNAMANAVPLLVMLVALSLYSVFSGKNMTPAVAFTSLSVINQLQRPLRLLPKVIAFYTMAIVSVSRLGKFFQTPEMQGYTLKGEEMSDNIDDENDHREHNDSSTLIQKANREDKRKYGSIADTRLSSPPLSIPLTTLDTGPVASDVVLQITRGSFAWNSESRTPILSDVNIEIHSGQLTMIVGKIGAGKSSLLYAMLGEMITLEGQVKQKSKNVGVGYASQTAWLINASLKENILFGNPYNQKRYRNVLEACCLEPDICILPMGDDTEIGEKGINLSGGQKQRISVARAMYSSNHLVILDDPLSALDVHVGSHMFFKGILDFLIEGGRTVVLVTHQIQYMEHADQVIFLQDGCIASKRTMREIGELDPSLADSWNNHMKAVSDPESEIGYCSSTDEERQDLKKRVLKTKNGERPDINNCSSKLMETEERTRGSMSLRIYWYYFYQFGLFPGLIVSLVAILQNVAKAGTQFWLSAWSSAGAKLPNNATAEESNALLKGYVGVYCAFCLVDILLYVTWTAILLIQSIHTSRNLHHLMLTRLIRAPMRFYDTTPIGRILNRFASDTGKLDKTQGSFIMGLMKFFLMTMSGLIVNAIISWYFVAAIIPIMLAYILLMKVYVNTSREIQRLVSISRSPVFAHFSESLGGLTTIRAYSLQSRFKDSIISKIERNHTAFCFLQASNRWLGIRLDLIGALIVLAAGLTSLAASAKHPATFGASLVGLAITYACKASYSLTWVVRNSSNVEMGMNSVERIKYYNEIENEQYQGSITPRADWPEKGHVVFNRVHARYCVNLPAIMQGVSIEFKPGMKVGICGRTGSGKSSLTLTLFRIIETFKGSIHIDGIDIAKLPLIDLRSRLAIIPQDPIMFTGTVRFNLDPESKRSDAEIWDALDVAQLKNVVGELHNNLDSMVWEGGDNFSVGERQLFCLARAMLKKSRILIMDEATASIDIHTDGILQEVVASAFQEQTVITIAHRVSTILDADKIVVLSEGQVAEFGTPKTLLEKQDSLFASLVRNN